ncbi:hypothetical protein JTB14_017365 [Gonioctena quinquepunctata]|nr:hypothetical protein JTB14_017365 [Gonioctena quinquepunctata]
MPRSVPSSCLIYISIFLILGFACSSVLGSTNTGSTDDPDPVTGLTSRDKYLVTSSYEAVRKTPMQHGMGILLLFKKKNPFAHQLFSFRDIPLGSLSSSPQFRRHCLAVMNGITRIIDSLDDSASLIAILTKKAEEHVPRGVTETLFTQLEGTIIEYLLPMLNAEQIDAWKKTLKVAFDVMRGVVKKQSKGK